MQYATEIAQLLSDFSKNKQLSLGQRCSDLCNVIKYPKLCSTMSTSSRDLATNAHFITQQLAAHTIINRDGTTYTTYVMEVGQLIRHNI